MFKIKEEVQHPYKNHYVVEVTGSYVSSPGEAIVVMGGFVPDEEDAYLEDLVNTCKRLVNTYRYGRDIEDNYYDVEGYEKWFSPSAFTPSERSELPEVVRRISQEWLADSSGVSGSRATFKSFEVFYYDNEGTKFLVEHTPENMKNVSSSMIKTIGYDEKGQKLRVQFKNGDIYVYSDVEKEVYVDLMNAHSIGRYFIQVIKNGDYEFYKES